MGGLSYVERRLRDDLSGFAQDNLAKPLVLDDTPCPDASDTRIATLNCLGRTVSELER